MCQFLSLNFDNEYYLIESLLAIPRKTGNSLLHCQWSNHEYECAVPEDILSHPMEGHEKILRGGGGVSKAKNFKGKCEAKMEFLEGWGGGLKPKNLP